MTDTKTDTPLVVRQIELRPLESRGYLTPIDEIWVEPKPQSFFRRHALFLLTVVVPVFLAFVYLFFIASDRYVSEARFIVRTSSGGSGLEGLASLVSTQGMSRANDETFAVNEYIMSRDAADLLIARNGLRDVLSRPEADIFNRFPNFFTRDSKTKLYKQYENMVTAEIEGSTGISTLEVTAFRPEDAQVLAQALLKYAEELINRLNERAHRDALRYAKSIVDDSKSDFVQLERRISEWRNQSGTVDPGKESIAGLEQIGKMSMELATMEASLAQTIAVTPANPSIPAMREKVTSYRNTIDKLRQSIVGNDASVANKLAAYEQFTVEKEIAGKAMAAAELNYLKARQDAERQQLYLQTIVEPNLPDQHTYPRRFLYLLGVIGIFGLIYMIIRSLTQIAMEHSA
ncbi:MULTISPECIES: hypothetical protein [unclassified Beijerinckia]|uniref:hypothetical protein n=1 Tax=unclassified Beijerinckia TaxID=2638183 RepID=UPI00089643BC|nr:MULTISPECIES: hypothetical protein [unclassified Beijerinckia]MDH7794327.1 capsular polysaccharide transport system permease protein [Beijerinckia sp. GAS462]SEB58948.1 capsular polysaccharide transport system permease protein [Beijerinckia sp. 28-YEA-48]